jgi:DNA-binding transcriptional LysR family regulator
VAGRIDVGLVRALPKNPNVEPQIKVEVIDHERLLVAMPSTHKLAQRKRVHLRELANEAFVTQPRAYSTTLYDTLIRMAALEDFHPVICQEAQQVTGLLALVSAGVGMALVPASMQVVHLPAVSLVKLNDKPADLVLAVAWRENDPSPVLARFLEAVRSSAPVKDTRS